MEGSSSMIRGHQIDAVGPRQVHVQDHRHDLLAAEDAQGLLAGGRDDDLEPLLDEILADGVPDRLFVVDHEQGDGSILLGHAGSSWGSGNRPRSQCREGRTRKGAGQSPHEVDRHPFGNEARRGGRDRGAPARRPAPGGRSRPSIDSRTSPRSCRSARRRCRGCSGSRAPAPAPGARGRTRCWRGGPARSARSRSAPRSRRTALPPSGSGSPVSSSHQAPRSAHRWSPESA